MNFKSVFAAVVITVGIAGAASASTYTFDFDNPANWDSSAKTYKENGYTFSPFQLQDGHCYDKTKCYIETHNGNQTGLSKDSGASFDVVSLYFNGQGTDTNTWKFWADGSSSVVELAIGSSYNTTDFTIFDVADLSTAYNGKLLKNHGYFIIFNDLFDNVTGFYDKAVSITQLRIDCVSISEDGSNMTKDQLGACTPSAAVPVPGSLPLMAGGFGLAAFALRRSRKNKKAA